MKRPKKAPPKKGWAEIATCRFENNDPTSSAKEPCKGTPLKNGLCVKHGGSDGSYRTIYHTNATTPEEEKALEAIASRAGTLDHEVMIMREQLAALKAKKARIDAGEEAALKTTTRVTKKGINGGRRVDIVEITKGAPDIQAQIDRATRTVAHLERLNAEIKGKLPPPPVDPSPIYVEFE